MSILYIWCPSFAILSLLTFALILNLSQSIPHNFSFSTREKQNAEQNKELNKEKKVQKVISGPVTVKKKSATGTVVNATSGTTYPVVAGDTYYVKVEKSGFTTVAFTYKAQPGALPLVVAMTAA